MAQANGNDPPLNIEDGRRMLALPFGGKFFGCLDEHDWQQRLRFLKDCRARGPGWVQVVVGELHVKWNDEEGTVKSHRFLQDQAYRAQEVLQELWVEDAPARAEAEAKAAQEARDQLKRKASSRRGVRTKAITKLMSAADTAADEGDVVEAERLKSQAEKLKDPAVVADEISRLDARAKKARALAAKLIAEAAKAEEEAEINRLIAEADASR